MMSGHRPPRFGVQQTFGWFRPADLYLNAIRRMPGYVCVGCGTYVKAVVRAGGVSTRCVPCRIDLRAERKALSRWWIDDPLVACECGRWFAPATRKRNAAMAGAIIHCPECDLLEPTPILIPQPVMWDLTERLHRPRSSAGTVGRAD